MSLQRFLRPNISSRDTACVKCALPQIRRKSTRKRCYSRHVIPFLPVVHSLKGLAILVRHREHGGEPFRDRRCYRRPYNSSPTAHSWKLDFCTPGEIFLSSGRRTAMASVFVIGRPFNSLRCIVCFSCGRSHFRRRDATSSSYFTLGKIPSRPLTIIYISHMIAEIGSLDNGVNFGEFNFRYAKRNAYFTSIKKKEKKKFTEHVLRKQM